MILVVSSTERRVQARKRAYLVGSLVLERVDADAVVEIVDLDEAVIDTLVPDNRSTGTGDIRDERTLTPYSEHQKQADASWGAQTGEAELADETAGETIAKTEEASGWGTGAEGTGEFNASEENPAFKDSAAPVDGVTGNGVEEAEAEPEDNHKSYNDFIAEREAKRMADLDLGPKEARAPNEGQKDNKQWKNAKPLEKEEEAAFLEGKEAKAKRERERKTKERVDIDFTFVEPERGGRGGGRGSRGGRGGERGEFRGRGGRGRGDGFRGDREGGGFRGDREGGGFRGDREGGFRGGRGRGGDRGDRGEFRGSRGRGGRGRGGADGAPAIALDDSAFPSLGSA